MQSVLRPISIAVVFLLTGCAGVASTGADDDPTFRAFTGEPVDGVRYAHVVEWHPLGRNSLRVRFDRNRHYVVELREPCVGHPRETDVLELDPPSAGRLSPNDRVLLDGRPCLIDAILPLDHAAWTRARRTTRHQSSGGT